MAEARAGFRVRYGGFLLSVAGRKGLTNDAPDWGVFALLTYEHAPGGYRGMAGSTAGPGATPEPPRAPRPPGSGPPEPSGLARQGPRRVRLRQEPEHRARGPGPGRRAPGRPEPRRVRARQEPEHRARDPGPAHRAPGRPEPRRVRARQGPEHRARWRPFLRRRSRRRSGSAVRDLNFEFDASDLTEDSKRTLESIATPSRPNPASASCWRATPTSGVPRSTTSPSASGGPWRPATTSCRWGSSPAGVDTISYGEERPLDPGSDELSWALNRAVHFAVRTRP